MLATTFEQSRFQQFDTSVEEGFASIDRFEQQLAEDLRTIRDESLYKEPGFKTFEEYCDSKKKWGGYRRVNQLLGFSQVTEALKGTKLDGVVSRESHARPILRLVSTPEKLQEAVAIAYEQNPNPTAKDFREAAQKVVPISRKSKVQEQIVPETGAYVTVTSPDHPRNGQTGTVTGDPDNRTHLFVTFPDTEGSELVAIKDLDAPSSAFTPRQRPKEYEEAIAQLKLQHKEEIARLESDIRIGLLTEAQEQAKQSVREQLEMSQAIANAKALEVAKLQQKIDELESLRSLEAENQQLQQRIGELQRALENRPVQEWGNTFTKQAEKVINAQVIKAVENLEPELHLRSLATSAPSDATEALRLMSLAMGNLAKALNDTQALSAAAILLKCNPTPEAITYQVELNQMVHQAVREIRQGLQSGCDWNGFWAIASSYETIKKVYWRQLTPDERNLITLLKKEFDQSPMPNAQYPMPNDKSPWLLTPQSWQSGGRTCKYIRMGELSLLFNDEEWLAISPSDTEKFSDPCTWLESWKEGRAIAFNLAHADINKIAYTYHGTILGVNPDLQEVRIQWREIPDARWYGASELRVMSNE